jgi:hypothetical protein
MDFNGDHPITYVANGSHAIYATAGSQEYTIALGIVTDVTNAGYACKSICFSLNLKYISLLTELRQGI